MSAKIQFWFEFASPYSYLAASRIEALAGKRDVEIEWCPFLLGVIFKKDLGYADSPFNRHPKKQAYLWRDVTRLCALRGLPPFAPPSPFPQNGLLAARVATALAGSPNLPQFVKGIYQAHFHEGRGLADQSLIDDVLRGVGLDPATICADAKAPEVKQRLRERTEEADALGIFGAPFFKTEDGELFWGDDRLEMAIEWAVKEAQTT